MVESKPSHPPEGNEQKIPTDRDKGKTTSPRSTKVRSLQKKPILETKAKTDLQVRCTDLEGYIFHIGSRASGKVP